MSKNATKNRSEKIKKWLSKPSNLLLLAILIFATILRFQQVVQVDGQALWWDEAEYGATAKKWAYGTPYELNPQRPPLFQFLWSILLRIGLTELPIKIILVTIPSIFLVFTVYLLGREMYNRYVGLMAALLTSVSWTFLFWSTRFQPDFFSMSFQILAIYFMWSYWKNESRKDIVCSALFVGLAMYFKISALLVPLTFMVFILIRDKLTALKNKDYYLFALTFILSMLPYFIWASIEFGRWTGFLNSGYSNQVVNPTLPFAWNTLNLFYTLNGWLLFYLFLAGLIFGLRFLLYFDIMLNDKKKTLNPDLFSTLILVVSSAFYIFYIRGVEDRWVFIWVPFLTYFIANFLFFSYTKLKKYNIHFATALVVVALLAGAYFQYNSAQQLIDARKESYAPVKLAGEWIKENSDEEITLLTQSQTQNSYYAERKIRSINSFENNPEFSEFINSTNTDDLLLQVSIFEPHPDWIQTWIAANQEKINPLQVYFGDEAKTQPILIVYDFN